MTAKLTAAQRTMLQRAVANSFADNSGPGAIPNGGHETRTLRTLAARGLVTLPMAFTSFSGAKATPTGRARLSDQEARDDG